MQIYIILYCLMLCVYLANKKGDAPMTRLEEIPTPSDKLFFYGSLRKGDYNNHFALKNNEPIVMATLTGYKMYSLGAYPFITPTDDDKDIVIGEIYKDIPADKLRMIDGMELGAGYDRELVEVTDSEGKKHDVIIYSQREGNDQFEVVKDGDWIKFKNNV